MNKNGLVALLLLVLGGCIKNYKVLPLKPLKKEQAHFVEQKDAVEVRVKKLERKVFGKYFNSFFSKQDITGYFLTIKNKSNDAVYFDAQDITLPLVSTQELYNNLSRYSLAKVGLGISAAAVLGGASYLLCFIPFPLIAGFIGSAGLLTTYMCIAATPLVFLGSVFSGANSAVFNQKLKKDLKHKVISSVNVKAGAKYSAIFVTRNNQKSFDITLQKGKGKQQKIVFDVTVNRV